MGMLLMRPRLRLAPNTCGFGLRFSQKNREILRIDVSVERAMLVAERFVSSLTNRHVPETEAPSAFPF